MITILIADDEPHITTLVRVTLEDERVRVLEAGSGEEALDLVDSVRPDLLLLDVNMPGIDGLEVCRRLRADPRHADTKIVMLTAAAQAADRARGREAGADEYLTKPFSPIRLLSVVQGLAPECLAWLPR
jgi:CheY-like chemotaxis protein